MSADLACVHCGALVSERAAVVVDDQPYCCTGCATVAQIVRQGGWNEFYERRDGFSPRPAPQSCAAFDSDAFRETHVRLSDDGTAEVDLQIEGIRCAACTWLVERATSTVDGVDEAFVSYGTGRARIRFRPDRVPLSQIAERIHALGYTPLAAEGRRRRDGDLLARLGVAAFVAMNVMLIAISVYAGWINGMEERHAALFRWASLALATPAVLYSAQPFFTRAFTSLRHGVLHMDVPIAAAIAIMYGHGVVSTVLGYDAYLDSLTMLIALLLGGRVVEEAGRNRAADAEDAVLAEAPTSARVVRGDRIVEIAAADVRPGDRVVVGAGQVVPVDGDVADGRARVDLSMLTGESEPVALEPGRSALAGAMVVDGHVELRATATGDGTALAAMARRVSDARAERAPVEHMADRIAPYFTSAVLVIAALTFLGWGLFAGWAAAIPPTIAVLVVACPCALTLGGSAAVSSGMAAAARRGAYVRDGAVLHRLAEIDRAVFDKTGTLTEGRPRVVEADDEVLRLATGLERASHHPIARAILDEAARRRIAITGADDIRELPGRGIEGVVEGRFMRLEAAGDGTIALREGDTALGVIRVRDRLRADAALELQQLGMPFEMLTGDAAQVAADVARDAGGMPVHAGADPDAKADHVAGLARDGHRVLYVGDGLNDAPALAAAHVGVAMASGSPASVLAADVVVLQPSVAPVGAALRAARETRRALSRNYRMSLAYNVLGVMGAVAGLVNPLVAAVLMPISSLSVIISSLSIERSMDHGHPGHSATPVRHAGGDVRLHLRESGA